MATRTPSLQNDNVVAINREIGSQYDNVKLVADNIEDVVAVANATAATQIVADNIAAITAIGTNMTDITVVGDNIVDVRSVSSNMAVVTAVASNLTDIDNVLSTVVPVLPEILLADDNAATATAMATTATTQAGLANTARVAAEAAQGVAKAKAAEAAASAVAADASADLAAASEVVANTKAGEAAASATAAHDSELAAAALLDAFNDIYLGSYSVDPTLDNDGQPLLDGALYFNTSINVLKVYDLGTAIWLTIPQVKLSGLSDVQLTSIATGDVLKWGGTKWVNTNEFSSHIVDANNPHYVTKSQVGLNNVDNTSDATKNVLSATKLTTARAISLTGDVTGTVNFNGSADVSIAAVVADNSHVHGNSTITDVDWTKISNKPDPIVTVALTGDVTGTANTTLTDLGDGTITVNTVVGDDSHLHSFANLTNKPTTLSGYGVTDAINVSQKGVANGVATLDASGLVPVGQLPSYVDDVLEYMNLGAFPAVGEPGKIYVALDTNKTYRWSGTVYIYITSGAVDSVAGKTGAVSLVKADVGLGNVDNTTDLLKPISTATTNALALKADDSTVVHKTGNETIAGVKAFTDGLKLQGQNVSPYGGFKNYIINGRKVINQRDLTSTDNSYNQDRWYKVGNNWYQGIEGDNNLISGKTYTLSWTGAATASYYVGTATSSTINAQTFTAIANGGSFTLTISAGQNLWIKFSSDETGSTFNFVQLEEGSVATPFENRPLGLELSLCQRYYEIGDGIILCSSDTWAFQGAYALHPFKSTKIATPTVTMTNVWGTISALYASGSVNSITITPSSQASDGQHAYYSWIANAEL